jgi:hypothetical protein
MIRPVSGLLIIAFATPSHIFTNIIINVVFNTVVLLLLTVTVAGAVLVFHQFHVSSSLAGFIRKNLCG